ncbi:MAG: hypothetical protein HY512_00705 [Candidatus Aenigmarchaeota archaeon]|nr:hypothetical protein [Candidatus Aenigmarchaeota archaeon]
MGQTVSVIVEGGKATAAPPLGPALGPLGVPIGKVVEEINKKTASLKGMQVPVKVIAGPNKTFTIEVGKPPTSALIKKELAKDKGSGKAGLECIGSLTMDQVKSIAKARFESDTENYVNQVVGTCRSMGVGVGDQTFIKQEAILRAEEKARAEEAKKAAAATAVATPAEGQPAGAPGAAAPAIKTAAPGEKVKEEKKRKQKKGK